MQMGIRDRWGIINLGYLWIVAEVDIDTTGTPEGFHHTHSEDMREIDCFY